MKKKEILEKPSFVIVKTVKIRYYYKSPNSAQLIMEEIRYDEFTCFVHFIWYWGLAVGVIIMVIASRLGLNRDQQRQNCC